MNIEQALDKLFSLHQLGIKLGLDKTVHLLNHIGNPQKKIKAIHVAGSNGKGSTSSFIASILMEAGYKVGLYTSPHLVRFNERVRINGIEIPDEYITGFMNGLDAYIDKYEPTFFELTTAIAFKYFAENNIDYAVIETGLGGRLDSTNTLNPMASVITQISLEHTNILGNKIEEIAYEKACIIKENTPVFYGYLPDEAAKVMDDYAAGTSSQLYPLNKYSSFNSVSVDIYLKKLNYHIYNTPLRGKFQLANAALAVLVVNNVFNIDDAKIISAGIKNVLENSRIQGRYEIYNKKPKIIFDAAHNLDGIQVFLDEFNKEKYRYDKTCVIFGCMRDKNIGPMLDLIKDNFTDIYITSIEYERAAHIDELMAIAEKKGVKAVPLVDPARMIESFEKVENNSCLVVIGSIYLLGDIKGALLELKRA